MFSIVASDESVLLARLSFSGTAIMGPLIILGIIFKSKKISFLGVGILIFCSLPIISTKLISYLEKDHVLQDISNIDNS